MQKKKQIGLGHVVVQTGHTVESNETSLTYEWF